MEPSSEASRPALQEPQHENQQQQQHRAPPSPVIAGAIAAEGETEDEPNPETATTHLARFEFSSDGGGTKILMVEWHPGAAAAAAATPKSSETTSATTPGTSTIATSAAADRDGWDIAWPGKSTNLPANDSGQDGSRRRVFFLLPPDAAIPTTVTITHTNGGTSNRLEVKPLPAIFPDNFDRDAGSRGVLHTLWARRRVAELEKEMDAEMRTNAESVGLEMAMGEKQWIVDNFLTKPKGIRIVVPRSGDAGGGNALYTPMSPKSPGGRLGEKLRGLKLATTPADLVPSPTANTFTYPSGPSAAGSDIAVSSMSAISQSNRVKETVSLDAAIAGQLQGVPSTNAAASKVQAAREEEDDLFALPMSPRSPDMKKSPFSMLK